MNHRVRYRVNQISYRAFLSVARAAEVRGKKSNCFPLSNFALLAFQSSLGYSSASRMSPQDLTDRLIIAVNEQDVLYVLYWLNEMKEMKCLREAINNKREFIHTLSRFSNVSLIVPLHLQTRGRVTRLSNLSSNLL